MRFVNRQHRELVWRNKANISKSKKHSRAFFVPDRPKEIAQERSLLRKAARRARDNEMKVEIRNNTLYLVNSQISYSLKELPEFLKEWDCKRYVGLQPLWWGVSLTGWICPVGLAVGFEVPGLQDWVQSNLVSQPQPFLKQ